MMMEWSPQQAMKAYLNTLELSKMLSYQKCNVGPSKPIQPECMELISALAAGNRAKLMVEITSGPGLTPFTIALAVAAKQTGGRLVCIHPPTHHHHDDDITDTPTCDETLKDVIEFVVGNPSEVIKKYKRVDFMAVDSMAMAINNGDLMKKVWENVEVNPRGCVVVATNLLHEKNRVWFWEIFKGKRGIVQCVTLPIGNGVELMTIRSCPKNNNNKGSQRFKRFHVTFGS